MDKLQHPIVSLPVPSSSAKVLQRFDPAGDRTIQQKKAPNEQRVYHDPMSTPRKAPLPSKDELPRPLAPSAATSNGARVVSSSNEDSAEKGSSVQVVVRMRPASEKEKASNDTMVVGVSPQHNEVRVITNFRKGPAGSNAAAAMAASAQPKTYTFDKAYGATSTQAEVYAQAVEPLVNEVMQGFNCTGQSRSNRLSLNVPSTACLELFHLECRGLLIVLSPFSCAVFAYGQTGTGKFVHTNVVKAALCCTW